MINELLHVGTSTATSTDLGGLADMLANSIKTGQHSIAVGLSVMLLVRIAGKLNLLNWVPAEGKKWVALGLAILGGVATGLVGQSDWFDIAFSTLTVTLTAIGSHEVASAVTSGKKAPEDGQ